MRNNKIKGLSVGLTLIALLASVFFFAGVGQADDHRKLKGWIKQSERDRSAVSLFAEPDRSWHRLVALVVVPLPVNGAAGMVTTTTMGKNSLSR